MDVHRHQSWIEVHALPLHYQRGNLFETFNMVNPVSALRFYIQTHSIHDTTRA